MNGLHSGLSWRHAALLPGVVGVPACIVSLVTGLDTVGVTVGNALLLGGVIVLLLLIVATRPGTLPVAFLNVGILA